MLYVADMSQRVCHSTIHVYLSAIRHARLERGIQDPLQGKTRLDLALQWLRRRCPRTEDARLPITPLTLNAIGHLLKSNGDAYEQLLVWAACCFGFFAFLRSGEFTIPAGSNFDRTIHVTPRDIAVDSLRSPMMLKVHLKASKMDPTRRGVDVHRLHMELVVPSSCHATPPCGNIYNLPLCICICRSCAPHHNGSKDSLLSPGCWTCVVVSPSPANQGCSSYRRVSGVTEVLLWH